MPVAVGLVVYFVTEPYLHTVLAGAAGVVVAELGAHWIVVLAYTLLFAVANFLSRRSGLAFLVFSLLSSWGVAALLANYNCAPPYAALGAIGGAPILALYLCLAMSLAMPNPSATEEEEEPDYSAYGMGATLEGLGRLMSVVYFGVLWLATVVYGCALLFMVVHRGIGLTSARSVALSLVLLAVFTLAGVLVIRVVLKESGESARRAGAG